MVRLAIEGNPAFRLSTIELYQSGPTYTADTLAALRNELGEGTRLHFILGADALLDLPNWHRPERIVALARLAVAMRPGHVLPELAGFEQRVPGLAAAIERIALPQLEISSSDLRRRAAAGCSLRYLVPDEVRSFIEQHALYRGS